MTEAEIRLNVLHMILDAFENAEEEFDPVRVLDVAKKIADWVINGDSRH